MTAPRPMTPDRIATVEDVQRLERKLDQLLAQIAAPPPSRWMTIPKAAAHYGRDASTVRRWIARGEIEARDGPAGREVRIG